MLSAYSGSAAQRSGNLVRRSKARLVPISVKFSANRLIFTTTAEEKETHLRVNEVLDDPKPATCGTNDACFPATFGEEGDGACTKRRNVLRADEEHPV
jgi:hypothetical protein